MADLRADFSLLASAHATVSRLISEFETIEDQAGGHDSAHGSGAIAGELPVATSERRFV